MGKKHLENYQFIWTLKKHNQTQVPSRIKSFSQEQELKKKIILAKDSIIIISRQFLETVSSIKKTKKLRSQSSVFNRQVLSFLQVVDIGGCVALSIILYLAHFSSSIGEVVLFSCLGDWHSIFNFSPWIDNLLVLNSILISVVSLASLRFSFFNIAPIIIVPIWETQLSINISDPFVSEERSEETIIFKFIPSIAPEILEDVVSSQWGNLTEEPTIVVVFASLVWKGVVSFINFIEFLSSIWRGIVFRMVLQSQFSISWLNIINWGGSRDTQNVIVVFLSFGVVSVKELFLILINHSMLLEESFESSIGILVSELSMSHIVIVCSFVLVGKSLISFIDFLEFPFSLFPVLFVSVRMPLIGKLFVSLVNFCLRGIGIDSKDFIVVFNSSWWHFSEIYYIRYLSWEFIRNYF